MKNSASMLAVLALVGSFAAVTATSAQAARAFTPYNPAQAYTGDPAYAQSRAEARGQATHRVIERHVAPQATGHNLPYADRPYGDPDSW
jgi:uroporphyrinogen-III synthase